MAVESRDETLLYNIILIFFGINWIFYKLFSLNNFWNLHKAEIIFKNAFFNTYENLNVFFYTKDKETNSHKLPSSQDSNYLFSVCHFWRRFITIVKIHSFTEKSKNLLFFTRVVGFFPILVKIYMCYVIMIFYSGITSAILTNQES